MNKVYSIVLVVLISAVYVLFFNVLYVISTQEQGFFVPSSLAGSSDTHIGFGESISITVESPRWYGNTLKTGAVERVSTLYIFNFVPLPLEFKDQNFKNLHISFLIFLVILLIIFLLKSERGDLQNDRNVLV